MTLPSHDTMHAALREFFAAIAAVDPTRIAAAFAEDGEIEDPVGSEIVKGRANIEASFATGLARRVRSAEVETMGTSIEGNTISAEWRFRAIGFNGQMAEATGTDVLTVNADGQLTRVAGYWDPTPLLAALA